MTVRTALLAALALSFAGNLHAQQGSKTGPIMPIAPVQSRQTPIPVARTGGLDGADNTVHADTHTLSSIEAFGVGSFGTLTSLFDPSFRVSEAAEKGTTTGLNGMSSLGMNLNFARNWNRSHLTGFYKGAKVLYYPDSTANATFHNLGVAEELQRGRWLFRLREDLLSSPEATLGGSDVGGLVLADSSNVLNSLQNASAASDTIITRRAKRLRNTTSGEVNYYFTRRSIMTVTGSYSSLTFSTAGYIDSHRVAGRVGYDYLLSPRDTVGVLFDHSRTDFSGVAPAMQTDSIQAAFGRKVNGRLAFQVMGGPQKIRLGPGADLNSWTITNNATYETRRNIYSAIYSHSSAGGSGIFSGATNHTIRGTFHRALTQWWSTSASGGYSFNKNLAPAAGTIDKFGNWYASANLERPLGRHMRLSLNYGFQRQSAGNGNCPVTVACASTALRQTGGFTMEWHPFGGGAL